MENTQAKVFANVSLSECEATVPNPLCSANPAYLEIENHPNFIHMASVVSSAVTHITWKGPIVIVSAFSGVPGTPGCSIWWLS
jgi:hypothetical protein